jgi:hypothetical protein
MMPHKNSKHCGKLYIDFLFFVTLFYVFGIALAWGLHNIFIVHGKHTNVGCTMARLCGVEILSQLFFVHNMC